MASISELNAASFTGDMDKVRALVESGADVNGADASGIGPLLTFHTEVISYLLSAGANPDSQKNENGASVLAGLCYVGKLECVRRLLEFGANPDLGRVVTMETPLHHELAHNPDLEMISLLIQHNADVNAKTKADLKSLNFYGDTPTRGETPLHRAAAYASPEIIQALIKAGAKRTLADANGHLPYHWAGWHMRSKDVVESLNPNLDSA